MVVVLVSCAGFHISNIILPILTKPCTITTFELEATHGIQPHESRMWVRILLQPDMYFYIYYLLTFVCFIIIALLIYSQYTYFECSLLDLGVGFGWGQIFRSFHVAICALFFDA